MDKKTIKKTFCCPVCKHSGYKALPKSEMSLFKMAFQCDKCSNQWSFGKNGGDYPLHSMNKSDALKIQKEYL